MAFLRSRGLKILLVLVGLMTIGGVAAGIAFYVTFVQDLPDLRGVADYRPPISSRVLDRDGLQVATYFEERRTLTPLEEVPNHSVMAFVAGEDSTFFEHSGIDYVSILRAAWVNLRAGGEIKQGASTITQQMVKGLLLSPERRFRRKIREMILARRIEQRFSKQEILYLYLNQIYFGHGAYGIGEAAHTYFDKPVGELSVSESALLAGLPKAPSRFSPFRNPERAEERRRYVLERMHVEGIIDSATYTAAVADVPVLADSRASRDDSSAAYFTEEVRRYLFEKLGGDLVLRGGLTIETTLDSELQRSAVDAVQAGLLALDRRQGYRGHIRQVAASEIQAEIEKLAEENEIAGDDARAAARERLLTDDATLIGVVTAVDKEAKSAQVAFAPGVDGLVRLADVKWAGKPDLTLSRHRIRHITQLFAAGDVARFTAVLDDAEPADLVVEATAFRVKVHQDPIVQGALLSIDVTSGEVISMIGGREFADSEFNRVTQARRQPGSAFKPIIYAASLAPREDGPVYTPATIVHDRPIVYTDEESGFVWRPRNYKRSFYGPITLREALARSVNNATVHLFRDIGIDYVIDYARRLGIESPLNRDLSLALGSSGMSLLEITRAYAVFPAGGRRVTPTYIRRVTDRDGNVLMENIALGPADQRVSPPNTIDPEFVDVAAGAMEREGEAPPDPDQVISAEEAYLATSMLRAVVDDKDGTGWRLRDLRRPLAGKTGTTNDQADAWFIGFSPDIATGVWVGHDESLFLGYGETGSRAAAPIWVDYMREALRDRRVRDFPVPDPIVFARIDRKTGLLADANSRNTIFQAFMQGTVPKQTANNARASSESRRQLRIDF